MNYSEKQIRIAGIIVRTGIELGASSRQIISALEAAWIESRLGTLDGGDNRTAWGVFQQTPHNGWGTKSQVQNPYYAANAFFKGAGTNRGLFDVWNENRSEGLNAQAVQKSAFPYRYDTAKPVALDMWTQIKSYLSTSDYQVGGEAKVTLPSDSIIGGEAEVSLSQIDLTKPTAQTSNLQRVVVLSVGLVLVILALGQLN